MIDIRHERLIGLAEARRILNCSRSSIYKYVREGFDGRRLEAVSVGGKLKTTVLAIQRFLGATVASPAAPITDDPHGLHTNAQSQKETWT